MVRFLLCVLITACLIAAGVAERATAVEYYISTSGSDSNNGAVDTPFATFDKAIGLAVPGDTIWVRGGTYMQTDRVNIPANRNGTAASRINLFAYPSETPIIDGANHDDHGFRIVGDFWHVKGLVIQHSTQTGLQIFGSNNIAEGMTLRWNTRSGVQLRDGSSKRPSKNLILNSDAYENADLGAGGEDADGFTAKYGVGTENVFRGNRAWGNSDDGWDFWEADEGVLVENSWSWGNGINIWGLTNFNGDGTGFKLGKRSGAHVLRNVLAWGNNSNGIDVNENGTNVQVYNATAYNNAKYNFQWDEGLAGHVLRNNVSLQGGMGENGVQVLAPTVHDHNSWNGIAVAPTDFLSLDDTVARGPRKSDGTLPGSNFLRLAPGSQLIDAGINVGVAFQGAAPDLGAFELIAVPPPPLPGDYNSNNVVDAADYVVWRKHLNSSAVLPNDVTSGTVDDSDYSVWREHFGQSLPGPASAQSSGFVTPEADSLALVANGLIVFFAAPSRYFFNRRQ